MENQPSPPSGFDPIRAFILLLIILVLLALFGGAIQYGNALNSWHPTIEIDH